MKLHLEPGTLTRKASTERVLIQGGFQDSELAAPVLDSSFSKFFFLFGGQLLPGLFTNKSI